MAKSFSTLMEQHATSEIYPIRARKVQKDDIAYVTFLKSHDVARKMNDVGKINRDYISLVYTPCFPYQSLISNAVVRRQKSEFLILCCMHITYSSCNPMRWIPTLDSL